ncbi:MAG: hypothetical protein NTY83_01820 [Candidatus Micrarchaeota archaeon]|nr:hypothetical protein [Candidatus Micrarchaeota archaeon]
MRTAIAALLLFGMLFAQVTTEGGNVTHLDVRGIENSQIWDGIYGDAVLGAGTNLTHTVNGGDMVLANLVAQSPTCNYTSIRMVIIAVNNTAATNPFSAGNLPLLDAFIGASQNGSATFTSTSTFQLNAQAISGVPTTYTYANNASSTDFRMGYLNDAAGNLVFVAVVVDDRPDWNGTLSDYQIMLPNNNGTPVLYTYWVDVNYTCTGNVTPPEEHDQHLLFIEPIGVIVVNAGETFNLPVVVDNLGDYDESNVLVHVNSCPAGFTCGSGTIPNIISGGSQAIGITFTADGPGEYVIRVYANSAHASAYRDFIVRVSTECSLDGDCPPGEYCNAGTCEPEKDKNETCTRDGECASGMCAFGRCELCESDSDCAGDEQCSGGECRKIECPCGSIVGHGCVSYQCCMDADCGAGFVCSTHLCETRGLDIILIDGTLVEGSPGLLQLVDTGGAGVDGGAITTNDGQSTITNAFGFFTIRFPYDGLIYGEKDGFPRIGKIFDVIKLGFFQFEGQVLAGQESIIRLVDSRGNGIPFVSVRIDGDTVTTDAEGYFRYMFRSPGSVTLKGTKVGYRIEDAGIMVLGGAPGAAGVCRFPYMLGWVAVPPGTEYGLWILSFVLSAANFFLYRKRTLARDAKALLYSFGPLAFAIPAYWPFSICFVANVVTVQAGAELLLLLKNALAGGEAAKEAGRRPR